MEDTQEVYGIAPPNGVFVTGLRCEIYAYAITNSNPYRGTARGRIVARRPNEPEERAYSTHTVETADYGQSWYAMGGDYDLTIEEAFEAFISMI